MSTKAEKPLTIKDLLRLRVVDLEELESCGLDLSSLWERCQSESVPCHGTARAALLEFIKNESIKDRLLDQWGCDPSNIDEMGCVSVA